MSYYTKARHKECIIEMVEIYGEYAVFCFCILNAYKYNYRAGLKNGNTAEQDYSKAKWYLNYANNLRKCNKKLKFNIIAYLMWRCTNGLF